MIRHRFPATFLRWTYLLSLLLVRRTLNCVGLSGLHSSPKQQALTKREVVTTIDSDYCLHTQFQTRQFLPDWEGSPVFNIYFFHKLTHTEWRYNYQLLPAPCSCSTRTEVIQLNTSVYNNKLKYNSSFLSSDYIQTLLSKQEYSDLKKKYL